MKFNKKANKRVSNKVVVDTLLQENVKIKCKIEDAINKIENEKVPFGDDFNKGIDCALDILKKVLGE